MNKEKRKINLIINELVTFFIKNNATQINIKINNLEAHTEIQVFGNCSQIKEKEIQQLKKKLSSPRLIENENLYWKLVGDIHSEDELYLLGTMVDKSRVDYDNAIGLKITINRENI